MKKTIYFAAGCFWGAEKLFRALRGSIDVTAGYANGSGEDNANYGDVCTGLTGFREAVRVEYDPDLLSLNALLFAFFAVVDPETPNRQGADVGSQYQAGIYWAEEADRAAVLAFAEKERGAVPVFAVELKPLVCFFPAEPYHQRYLEKNPGGYCHVSPRRIAALAAGDLEALATGPLPAKQALAALLPPL